VLGQILPSYDTLSTIKEEDSIGKLPDSIDPVVGGELGFIDGGIVLNLAGTFCPQGLQKKWSKAENTGFHRLCTSWQVHS
jgi:hypothetical protein